MKTVKPLWAGDLQAKLMKKENEGSENTGRKISFAHGIERVIQQSVDV